MDNQATLTSWLAEEDEIHKRMSPVVGCSSSKEIASRTGLEFLNGISDGAVPTPPVCVHMDITPIKMEHGLAVFQGRPRQKHYNPLGSVHGGWYSTLLDSALGCAVHTTLPAGKGYTTLELKVNMLRRLTADVPVVRATGRVIHVGGQIGVAVADIVAPDGKVYAHATTTCLIFDLTPRQQQG